MRYLSRLSPLAAIRDLRFFLSARSRIELGFFVLSVLVTTAVLAGLWLDSRTQPRPYSRTVIYAKDWREDRSDAQIIAQQRRDLPAERAAIREQQRREQERRAGFQRLDRQLDDLGF